MDGKIFLVKSVVHQSLKQNTLGAVLTIVPLAKNKGLS
jgi:hypothetical protein